MRLAFAAFMLVAGLGLKAATTETAKPESPPVLRKSPEFVIKFNDGHEMQLSSLKGKVVALLMVHTTCPHCQHTSVVFTQLYKEYGPRGFQPVDAAFNTMANMLVPDFVKNFQIGYPVGYSTPEDVMAYLDYPITERYTVPQIVWIDKRGNIRSQTTAAGEQTEKYQESYWRNMIETLLKEPASAAPAHHSTSAKAPTSASK
jgi:thiol-disulfide isomerase/thioredoxin